LSFVPDARHPFRIVRFLGYDFKFFGGKTFESGIFSGSAGFRRSLQKKTLFYAYAGAVHGAGRKLGAFNTLSVYAKFGTSSQIKHTSVKTGILSCLAGGVN
jgi:hypothetical protein